MKYLRIALYTLLGIILLYLLVCAFSPAEFTVNRSIEIQAAPAKIFPHVSDFKQWSPWSPFHKSDPAMVNEYAGEPGTVGHKNTWKSEVQGDGTQEIVEIRPDAFIKTSLQFSPDPSDVSYSTWTFTGDSTRTKVEWDFKSGKESFFMRGVLVIFDVEGMLNKSYDQGLADLKKLVESGGR